jgi:hypothetical protein
MKSFVIAKALGRIRRLQRFGGYGKARRQLGILAFAALTSCPTGIYADNALRVASSDDALNRNDQIVLPGTPLDLSQYSFLEPSTPAHEAFPHRVTFGDNFSFPQLLFPLLKYVSVRDNTTAAPYIVVAAKVSDPYQKLPDFFDISGDTPHGIQRDFIVDPNPVVNERMRQSVKRSTKQEDNKLVIPISADVNVVFTDDQNNRHRITMVQESENYTSDIFKDIVPEDGCILFSRVYTIKWDNIYNRIVFVLRSSNYDGEVYGYTGDRSCSNDYAKKHNSKLADVGDAGFLLTSRLVYLKNTHDIFSFPIEWLNPLRSEGRKVIVEASTIISLLSKDN